jgi:hypothetical protein
MCWGWNWYGQLGTGSADDKDSPLAVNLGSGRSSKGGKEGGRREGGREGGRDGVMASFSVYSWPRG